MKLCLKCLSELFDSDTKCINCGNSTLITQLDYENIKSDLQNSNYIIQKKLLKNEKYQSVYNYLIKKNGDKYWKDIRSIFNKTISDDKNHASNSVILSTEQINIPKCPTCGSTNISKIGVINRSISVGLFGLGSGKIGKNRKCNDCGNMW